MLFSSSVFIFLFLPAALLGYQILSRFGRLAMLSWLAAISMFFYAYWNPPYLLLLLASIVMNYLFASRLGEGRSERSQTNWLILAIIVNLLLLMYFKYLFPLLNFFSSHGLIHHGFADAVLPLGISFFTFTQIAYLIDLRQGYCATPRCYFLFGLCNILPASDRRPNHSSAGVDARNWRRDGFAGCVWMTSRWE